MATTGGTGELLNLHERSDGIDGESEVLDWVEWKSCGWGRAWKKRAKRVDLWWRGGAEVVENEGHVLLHVS